MSPLLTRAQTWQSALVVGAGSGSEVRATAVDAAGNVYLAGGFTGTIQVGSTTLTSAGSGTDEIFVAKWNSASRSFAWAVRAGGSDIDFPNALAVTGSSVYVVGAFNSSTADFGSITLTNSNTGSQRSANLFVWKLADGGATATTTWALRANGSAQALAVAGNSLYVGGMFSGTSQLGATLLTSAGSSDVLVSRLTDAGSTAVFDWAVRSGGTGADELDGLAVQGGSVYAAGDFEETATFGSVSLSSAGRSDVFAAKLTEAGSYVWVQRAGGPEGEYLRGLAVSGSSVYLAGEFASPTAAFGPTSLTSAGNTDGFVAKLSDAGASAGFAWAQRLGGGGYESLTALVARGSRLYVAGHFDGASTTLGSTTLANTGAAGTYDLYAGSLLDAGSTAAFNWAQRAGSAANDFARSLTTQGTAVYLGGSVGLPATFGSQALAGTAGSRASFLATLLDPALPTRAATDLPGLGIYPNPARHAATVQVPAGTGAATVQLLDALGRVVREEAAAAGTDHVLAGLLPGLYAVRVQVGAATATQRLVVE